MNKFYIKRKKSSKDHKILTSVSSPLLKSVAQLPRGLFQNYNDSFSGDTVPLNEKRNYEL